MSTLVNQNHMELVNTKHNNFPPKEEYLFIRTEILQYMQNYQNVRNMMYIVTATCLGFVPGADVPNPYFYLLPLFIIMPSFLVAINFWKCVIIDSLYLRVFHEENRSTFQWESRHDSLYKDNRGLEDKINVQYLPYISCAVVCLAIFWYMALQQKDFL